MNQLDRLQTLAHELSLELTDHLLPFWAEHTLDEEHGGFVGQITQDGRAVKGAPKGAVLNARILWTFAAAAEKLGDRRFLDLADRAHRYIRDYFWDQEHGGVYWSVDSCGTPLDTTKRTYAQAFTAYALAQKFRTSADSAALDGAIRLFRTMERHGYDPRYGGYLESFSREWGRVDDMRLSDSDDNAPKSMNTQLHVLEAFTTLYECWPADDLRERLEELIGLLVGRILDPEQSQMRLFFEADWTVRSSTYSYGHDIEASWLLLRAVEKLESTELRAVVKDASVALADTVLRHGQDTDGGIFWSGDRTGPTDTDKHWWPQAEAIVGFVTAFIETSEDRFLDAAIDAWTFTKKHVVDHAGGEWLGRLTREGVPYDGEDKVGLWKCPYHNARACLEAMTYATEAPSKSGVDK